MSFPTFPQSAGLLCVWSPPGKLLGMNKLAYDFLALHRVTFRFVAQKWKCFAAFLQGLPFQIERILRQVSDLKKTLNPTLFTCGSHQILCTLTNGKFPNDILPENVKSTLGLSQKSPGTSDQARQTVLPNQATRFRTWTL